MLRSALLALDNSDASRTAQDLAISFCQQYIERTEDVASSPHLTGVAVVDEPHIKYSSSMPIGAGSYKKQRDETLMKEAEEITEQILRDFQEKCTSAGVPHSVIRSEGLPYEQIEKAARKHDIILIGRDTNFHYETSESVGATVKKLLIDNARPVVVYPPQMPENHRVLVAYDGSIASSHALHMWTLLNIRRPQTEVHVACIRSDEETAKQLCEEAKSLLASHHCDAILHPMKKMRSVVEELGDLVNELSPRMVVLGAYGRGGLQEALFGSFTNKMLETATCPLFLFK